MTTANVSAPAGGKVNVSKITGTYAPPQGFRPPVLPKPNMSNLAEPIKASEEQNSSQDYLYQQVMTCPQAELPLLLYNGGYRFCSQAMMAIDKNNLSEAHNAIGRAQDIVQELLITLNNDIEVSKQLAAIYDYIEFRLIQANIKKSKDDLEEARNMFSELRDTWSSAMKIARKECEDKKDE